MLFDLRTFQYVTACCSPPLPQGIKKKGGVPAVAGSMQKIRAEAERLDVMDKAAGVMAELLYSEKLLTQIKEYRPIMLHVSTRACACAFYYCAFWFTHS